MWHGEAHLPFLLLLLFCYFYFYLAPSVVENPQLWKTFISTPHRGQTPHLTSLQELKETNYSSFLKLCPQPNESLGEDKRDAPSEAGLLPYIL